MKKLLYLFILAGSMLISSCESMISDVDIDPGKPKMVVNSYLYPGMDTVHVFLTLSKPLYTITNNTSYERQPITDAQVSIIHQDVSYSLIYNPNTRDYISNSLSIQTGNTYQLRVVSSSGEVVTASCTIPVQSPPEIEITSIQRPLLNSYERIINFRFQDLEGLGDYYRVTGGFKYQYGPSPQDYWFDPIYMQAGEEFVSDQNRDGEFFIYKTNRLYVGDQNNKVYIYLSKTDKHYHKYHQSVFNFEGENPFAEPVPVYSNIEGGLGVFASFYQTVIEVDL